MILFKFICFLDVILYKKSQHIVSKASETQESSRDAVVFNNRNPKILEFI